ncbi:methyltransferase domain-containing protein [bacterium]|nr:methyltransferase domain-containing protein [bacterium]
MSPVDNVFGFIDLLTGYQQSMVIMAAGRLGLFDSLGEEPRTSGDIAAGLDLDESALDALLRSMAAIGMAVETDDGFSTTPFALANLRDGRDWALVVRKEEYFARAWLSLEDVVRTGAPALAPWRSRLASDPQTAEMFLAALNVLAEGTGPKPWELADLAPGKRVLDVGGGLGFYAAKLAEAGSTVVVVDLPAVIDMLAGRISDTGIELVAADVMTDPSCGVEMGSVDAALVSHMLHDLSPEGGIDLLRRVWAAVAPGGSVIVNDFAGDAGPGAFGPLFDVMMRVETGGAAHPLATLRSIVEEAGFEDVEVLDLPEPLTVLRGKRS